MKTITVFTPTYNRANVLIKAYESLLCQTNKDFVWLIVDDGSEDNTSELVEKWKNEDKIEIKYVKKENGGKHSAYNLAVDLAKTELFLNALDSDDYLEPNAIEFIIKKWKKCEKNIIGIVTLCDDKKRSGIYLKKYNKEKIRNCSLSKAFSSNYFLGSAIFVYKTSYARKYKFPIIENENFFTEAYIYYQMKEPMLWSTEVTCIREYREDGLTKNINKVFLKNPKSWFMYNKLRMKMNKSFSLKIKFTIYYISFGLIAKEKKIIIDSPYKFLTTILYPVGILGFIFLRRNK